MERLVLGLLLVGIFSINIFAYTITEINSDNGIHFTFVGHCDGRGVFNGNSTPTLNEAYICGPIGNCFHAKSKEVGIRKACAKTKTSIKYGYLKKGAHVFNKRKGDGSIEWALTSAPGKIPHMDKVIMDSMLKGKYAVRRNADNNFKIKLLKKYTNKSLLQSYWKARDARDIFYVLDKDVNIK